MIARRVHAAAATRIALVADSHGVLTAGLVADLTGVDLILHAGDVGSTAVLRELRSVAAVHAVAGNNDVPRKWPPGFVPPFPPRRANEAGTFVLLCRCRL